MSNHIPKNETDQASDQDIMVCADHVSMMFNIANERISNLKEYFIKIVKHELMFKEFKALDDVSFEVRRGDVFGLVGTNGSGKSTMLKIIAGVLDPTEGTCAVNGTIAPLIELGAGFDMELSARENIYLNGALLGYSKQFMDEHFDSIVEFADVEGFLEMPMKNYSSGMVARIAFAIATETIPDILIVDEVLSVGDFMFQKKCEKRISSLIEDHGVTVLIVSHDNALIQRLCNKAIWIEKGHTRAYGDVKEVCDLYRVLGGHSGNKKSSDFVKSILESDAMVDVSSLSTISVEDAYSASAKLLETVSEEREGGTLVVAPGESPQTCFIANSVAGLLDAPVLLSRNDSIPDIVSMAIERMNPTSIISLHLSQQFQFDLEKELRERFGCEVESIIAGDLSDLAIASYEYGVQKQLSWSETCILTHPDCCSDHISISPYSYSEKVPVFFNSSAGELADTVIECLTSGEFDKGVIVGGYVSYPDSLIAFLAQRNCNIEFDRLFADEGYKASADIATWISRQNCGLSLANTLITSAWFPENALTVGRYCSQKSGIVLMEDPQNLDSVLVAFNFISRHKSDIKKLTFLGNSSLYNGLDKSILAKALVLGPTPE